VSEGSLLELDPTGQNDFFGVPRQKHEDGIADSDLVAVLEVLLLHGGAVHERAVAAVQVLHFEAVAFADEYAMAPRDRGVGNREQIRGIPADG
jgi:hypothetical protein